MKHVTFPEASPVRADLLTAAARCWRTERDAGRAPAPPLHALLAAAECPMLAAAFDSLFGLYEAAVGRSFAVGWSAGLSEDEQLLANLLRTTGQLPRCLALDEGAAQTLDCALCSTRLLLGLAGEEAPARA